MRCQPFAIPKKNTSKIIKSEINTSCNLNFISFKPFTESYRINPTTSYHLVVVSTTFYFTQTIYRSYHIILQQSYYFMVVSIAFKGPTDKIIKEVKIPFIDKANETGSPNTDI